MLSEDMTAVNHPIKHVKNNSQCEDAEEINYPGNSDPLKQRLTMWKFTKIQQKEYPTLL